MRSIYVRTTYWFNLGSSGPVGHTKGVIDALDRLGDVHVLTNDKLPGVDESLCELVPPIAPWLRVWGEALYNPRIGAVLRERIDELHPDFVYHRHSEYTYSPIKVCRDMDVPMVLEFNSFGLWKLEHWHRESLKRRLFALGKRPIVERVEPYNIRNSSLIVVVARALVERLVSFGVPEERILVNPNAVDSEVFQPRSAEVRERIIAELGIQRDIPVVGFAGTFRTNDGVTILKDVIKRINADARNHSRVQFVLYGDGDLFPMMQAETAEYPNVTLVGSVPYERMPEYLSVCDICVSPHTARVPGSPTKLYEYMAMERAIVATNIEAVAVAVTDGETGYLVEPGETDAMAERILYLADNPEERRRLGENARREAQTRFSWTQNVQNVMDKLRDLGLVS